MKTEFWFIQGQILGIYIILAYFFYKISQIVLGEKMNWLDKLDYDDLDVLIQTLAKAVDMPVAFPPTFKEQKKLFDKINAILDKKEDMIENIKIKSLEDKIVDLKKDYDRQFWRYVELEKNYNVFVEKTLARLSVEPDICYERKFKESEE